MKKIILFIVLLLIVISSLSKAEAYTIPSEAIRLRVIANSNSEYDQRIKFKVTNQVQETMHDLLENVSSIDYARLKIKSNIPLIESDIKKILKYENYNLEYHLNYGNNYFPKKIYKNVVYKEGYYESLVVTLGSGEGNNWWCVLFPPLCLMEAEESEKKDYKFFVQELFEKYL